MTQITGMVGGVRTWKQHGFDGGRAEAGESQSWNRGREGDTSVVGRRWHAASRWRRSFPMAASFLRHRFHGGSQVVPYGSSLVTDGGTVALADHLAQVLLPATQFPWRRIFPWRGSPTAATDLLSCAAEACGFKLRCGVGSRGEGSSSSPPVGRECTPPVGRGRTPWGCVLMWGPLLLCCGCWTRGIFFYF